MIAWKHRDPNPKIASFRYRVFNPHLALLAAGVDSELFNSSNLDKYSIVIFSKAYTNNDILLAKKLQSKGIKVIFDICDNHFYNPNSLPEYFELKNRLLEMVSIADLVTFSTEVLAHEIKQYCNKNITVIPDLIFSVSSNSSMHFQSIVRLYYGLKRKKIKKLVWYGIHGSPNSDSGMNDLIRVKPFLEDINSKDDIELSVVSNSLEKFKQLTNKINIPMSYKEWSERTVIKELLECVAVIVPITPSPFTWCKSNNRILLPLSLGVSVIADSIPSYETFHDYCFLDSWESGLNSVIRGRKISREGKKQLNDKIHSEFGFAAIGQLWIDSLDAVS